MQRLTDAKQIQAYVEKYGVSRNFDTKDITFRAFRYEKGELLSTQGEKSQWLHFVVEGAVRVYDIHEDGSLSPVNVMRAPVMVGDFEFANHGISPFYVEAEEDCLCLSFSMEEYWKPLERDITFLHVLLESYAEKVRLSSMLDISAQSLEEKVMRYLACISKDHEINGTEKTAMVLKCSRRQLQRVLQKLCMEEKIEKVGRGCYRLVRSDG